MLNKFKQGTAHLAIVVEDPQKIVSDTDKLMEAMHKGTDMQMSVSAIRHEIIGITTLEKIIEKILSTAILDEKDVDKRTIKNNHHYSMTIMNEESLANLGDMTELNETARDIRENMIGRRPLNHNHMSEE